MTKRTVYINYRTAMALTSLWFAGSGFLELTKNPAVWEVTLKSGYPSYFIYVPGIAKLSGVAVLLIPGKLLWLKEWAFAGLFFDIVFAFASKASIFGIQAAVDTVVAFILVAITYRMYRKVYRNTNDPGKVSYEVSYTYK